MRNEEEAWARSIVYDEICFW